MSFAAELIPASLSGKIETMHLARVLSLFITVAAVFAAADKPDFSGEWTINLNRSEYGAQPAPHKLTEKIQHKGSNIRMEVLELSPLDQEVKYELKYVTDGKETSNTMLGSVVKSTASWIDNQLAVHSWSNVSGWAVDIKDRWRLVENGTTLIVERHLTAPSGNFDETLVFDKK